MALTDESPPTRLLRNSQATPKRRSGWRRYRTALALFVLLGLGAAYVGLVGPAKGGAPADRSQRQAARDVPTTGSSAASVPAGSHGRSAASLSGGATGLRAGVPVGYAPTREGAQSAAVNYAVA